MVGVCGWGKPSSLRVMRRGTDVCQLWKIPPTYSLAVEDTTCLSILYYVWVVPFDGGGRCGAFVDRMVEN